MNDTSAADANRHMIYMSVFGIENQVAGLCIGHTDFFAYAGLFAGCPWKADSEFTEYCLRKSGTVCAVSQAGTSVYIWVSDKLQCVRSDG